MDAVGVETQGLTLDQKVDILLARVGTPADGDAKATGLHGQIANLDGRLKPFEQLHEQATGGIRVLTITGPAFAVVLWFLLKEKVRKLFGL